MAIVDLVKAFVSERGANYDPFECRHCGTSFGDPPESCPVCGSPDVARIAVEG